MAQCEIYNVTKFQSGGVTKPSLQQEFVYSLPLKKEETSVNYTPYTTGQSQNINQSINLLLCERLT